MLLCQVGEDMANGVAQDLQEMEKNLSAINEDLNRRQKNIVGSLRRLMQIIVKQTINI